MIVNDFKCLSCGFIEEKMFKKANIHALECGKCGSKFLERHLGGGHISSDGGKGLAARTPDGFKEVLKAIKKGVPEKKQGDRFNTI